MRASNRLFTKPLAELTAEERFIYMKMVVLEFLNDQFNRLYFFNTSIFITSELKELNKKLNNCLIAIENAVNFDDIDLALQNVKIACDNWKGDLEDRLKAIAWQCDKLSIKIYNFDFYIRYGIIIHPVEQKTYREDAETPFNHYKRGLPPNLIRDIQEDPNFCLVYVSGATPWGHALLFLGKAGFIHIDRPRAYPKHMTIAEFNQYLSAEHKIVLGMQKLDIQSSNDAILKINELFQSAWHWFGVKHNCVSFCEEISKAGRFDLQKLPEYRQHFLLLPTKIMDSMKHQSQLVVDQRRLVQVGVFSTDIFSKYIISVIDVLENFNMADTLRFLNYVALNMKEVMHAQNKLMMTQPKQVNEDAIEFEVMQLDTPTLDIACKRIQDKLSTILNKIKTSHAILFDNDVMKELRPEVANYHKISMQAKGELEVHYRHQHRFFSSSVLLTPPSCKIRQDEDERPRLL